ncbi:MAG: M3 family metallopeptidase [Bacillota bacterium]
MQKQRIRAEVPVEETWRTEDIFPSPEAWEAEFKAILADQSLAPFKGRLGEGPAVLKACLEALEALMARAMRVGAYAMLNQVVDFTNPAGQVLAGRAQAISSRMESEGSRIRSELLQLPAGAIERFLAADPELAPYRPMLEQLLVDRPHALSPEAEAALAIMSEPLELPTQLFRRTTAADMRFEPVTDSQGQTVHVTLGSMMMQIEHSPDTTLRRRAYESMVKGLKGYEQTLATSLGGQVRRMVLTARMRGYNSAIEMFVKSGYPSVATIGGPHAPSVEAFDRWMETVLADLAPHMRRYAELRRRVLGLDKLLHCDLQAPFGFTEPYALSYEQGAQWIQESVAVLGPEYQEIIKASFAERWIDRADNAGKPGMAFCNTVSGVHPYVFSTWTGGLRGLFILAHELGHAGHGAMAHRYQRLMSSRTALYFVEAPSTLNELLLTRHIRSVTDDPALHRQVIMTVLSTYFHNFVTHLLEAELLRRIYRIAEQDRPITAKVLGDETADLLKRFWGDAAEIDEGARLTWMRQGHYYMGIYPYTYSVGLAAATAVARMIETEGDAAASRWVEVLKAGGSRSGEELFRMAGVEITAPETLQEAIAYVGSLVDELERSFN